MSSRRPFKVLDETKLERKCVMAANLEELMTRGQEKLGYSSSIDLKVVLEEDGTEIDDEEYFGTLPNNTAFILLPIGERLQTVTKKLVKH